MDLETLKKLLEDGIITQAQFDSLSANNNLEDAQKEKGKDSEKEEPEKKEPEDLEILIQRAVDRATNKLGNDNKKLKEDLEKERKKNLTSEELRTLEIKEKEQEIADREKAIKEKENRLYAIKALKKAKLDSGEEEALELIDFVLGEDETVIDTKVSALQKFAEQITKRTTDIIYRTNGRIPDKSSNGSMENNPYKKETFNFTKQMELEVSNPEEAKRLRIAAGLN